MAMMRLYGIRISSAYPPHLRTVTRKFRFSMNASASNLTRKYLDRGEKGLI